MRPARVATLTEIGAVLETCGYRVRAARFEFGGQVIVAESLYAVVGCVEVEDWTELRETVEDFQAELTRLSTRSLSARRWDLYVFAHVLVKARNSSDESLAEVIESDTRYARKFVRVALPEGDRPALERALRPLLPLRAAPEFEGFEPIDELREQLRDLGVPDNVAEAALTSFTRTNEVSVS